MQDCGSRCSLLLSNLASLPDAMKHLGLLGFIGFSGVKAFPWARICLMMEATL